jgi:enamine deaminase RidA (YjgF/YER057c/UK114 family)
MKEMANIEKILEEKGIVLGKVPTPVAEYVPAKTIGNLVYTSGCDCRINGVLKYEGKVGSDLTVEQGYDAARQTMINIIAVLKEHLGDLDRIKQVVKMLAFVNSADGFAEQPYVVNGASELLVEIFGARGKHARSAISSNELPFNTPVEIELIVEIEQL